MKVNQSGSPAQGSEIQTSHKTGKAASTQETRKGERAHRASVKDKSSDVKAEISPKSKEFAHAKSIASEAPDIREDKVADLKKRISEGTYKLDHEGIADRMVDDHIRMSNLG